MYTREVYAITVSSDAWTTMFLDRDYTIPWLITDPTRALSCRFRVIARGQPAVGLNYACAEFEGSFVCYYDASTLALVVIPESITQTAATALSREDLWDVQVTSTAEHLEIQCTQTSSESLANVLWEGYVDVVDVKVTEFAPT